MSELPFELPLNELPLLLEPLQMQAFGQQQYNPRETASRQIYYTHYRAWLNSFNEKVSLSVSEERTNNKFME